LKFSDKIMKNILLTTEDLKEFWELFIVIEKNKDEIADCIEKIQVKINRVS